MILRSISLTFFSIFLFVATGNSWAAPGPGMSRSSQPSQEVEQLKHRYEVSVDLQAAYVRDTRAVVGSDTAARLNLGGMFTSWVGLDVSGMLKTKSKSYLVSGDLKLVPIDWLFFKVGAGAYSDRVTRSLVATPVLGAGLTGRFSEYYYMVAEALYYKVADQGQNAGIGIGLGMIF